MQELEELLAKWRRQTDGNFSDRANAMSRCADELEEAMKNEPRWISVSEATPPNGEHVEVRARAVRHGGKHSTTWAIGTTSVTHWRSNTRVQRPGTGPLE